MPNEAAKYTAEAIMNTPNAPKKVAAIGTGSIVSYPLGHKSISQDEPRVTLDYPRAKEDSPTAYLQPSSKVHDDQADPRYKCLFAADLKHAFDNLRYR